MAELPAAAAAANSEGAAFEKGVAVREQQIGGSGGSLEPPGPLLAPPGHLLTHLHTVYIAYIECLPTRLNPPAERTCFSQVAVGCTVFGMLEGRVRGAVEQPGLRPA
jgi:hypothetical protein